MMLRVALFVVAFNVLTTHTRGQAIEPSVSFEDISLFMNWFSCNELKYSEKPPLSRKRVSRDLIKWDARVFWIPTDSGTVTVPNDGPTPLVAGQGLNSCLSLQDIEFMSQQARSHPDTVWKQQFNCSRMIDANRIDRKHRYYFSLPLFSRSKKYVAIRHSFICGSLCGHGGTSVFRRTEGDAWELVAQFSMWVS